MDSFMSLGSPLKQFTSCVSGQSAKANSRGGAKKSQPGRRRSSFSRRQSVSRRRSLPVNSQKVPDSWLRLYQDDLKRERKRQQAVLAKKNAERAVRRTTFRRHHCLPRQTTTARKPAAAAKDTSFLGALQGLSLEGVMGGSNGATSTPAAANGDQCKVM